MLKKYKRFWKKNIVIIGTILGSLYVAMQVVKKRILHQNGERNKVSSVFLKKNRTFDYNAYKDIIKPTLDKSFSFVSLILLSPLFVLISVVIYLDDPGPVFFKQKRVGKGQRFFSLHKFRSMKMSTPHDVPTHQLCNPEQYITRVGRLLRKTSLDELPQIWDIFCGNMSIIGPRPALWNQEDLIAEREKYNANSIMPGLTGLAQIRGRDELEISLKAEYDGAYTEALNQGGFCAFFMDMKCFLGTIKSVLKSDGVVEGGTGQLKKEDNIKIQACNVGFEDYGYKKTFCIDTSVHNQKKVLITGAGSYIGESFRVWAETYYKENLIIDTVDMIDGSWREFDFSPYDCVFHVAGIAHADVGHVSEEEKKRYYSINTDLAIETAQKAKESGVKQFVFMSSMIIYGQSASYGKKKIIDEFTLPSPFNFYGDSKWQADKGVRKLGSADFHVAVLRPPMIYGEGAKGNYPILVKLAKKLPIFPMVDNERSMLYIDNFCDFLCKIILSGEGGIYFPQNKEYSNTCALVKEIGRVSGKKIFTIRLLNFTVRIGAKVPGKLGDLVNKAFGNFAYNQKLSVYKGLEYDVKELNESIKDIEFKSSKNKGRGVWSKKQKLHILIVSQYFYPENFRINDIATEWVKRGYKVTVVTGIPNYPIGKFFDGYGYIHRRKEQWNGIDIIRIPLIPRGNCSIGMIMNYISFAVSGFFWKQFSCIKADLVFTFEVSPMTQALIGVWYAKKHHIPHFLYVQDLWPENVEVVAGVHNPIILKPINYMVDYIYKNADKIFTTSPSFAKAIEGRKVLVNSNKIHYWPQYAEEFYNVKDRGVARENLKQKSIKCLIQNDDCFKVVFTGNIGTAQGLDVLPKVAKLLLDRKIHFVIVGDGRYQKKFESEIERYEVKERFTLISRQPAEIIPELLALCDVAFLSFIDTDLFAKTIPAKLQSYMACGMVVLAAAKGETERVIKEAQCGVCVSIGDAQACADAIKVLMKTDLAVMKRNSRNYALTHFNKRKLMDEMDVFIKNELK